MRDTEQNRSDDTQKYPRGSLPLLNGKFGALLRSDSGCETCAGDAALQNFLKNSPDPILFFNGDSELIGNNRRAKELWGDGNNFLPPTLMRAVKRVRDTGLPYSLKQKKQLVRIKTSIGARFFLPNIFRLFSEAVSMRGPNNESDQIIACMLRDETAWELSERIRNNLFSSISHELNTPLTSARLALYLLHEEQIGTLNEHQRVLVNGAKQDLDREITTIGNLLDLMRSDSVEPAEPDAEPLGLHQLIEAALDEFRTQMFSLKMKIKRSYSSREPYIMIDHDTAQLVFSQMLSAFIKYAEEGTTVQIQTAVNGKECRLELIVDCGALMDFLPDDLFTLPMESDEMRHLGCVDLGIRVAHEMIRDHGGELGLEKTQDRYVLFFCFPMLNAA